MDAKKLYQEIKTRKRVYDEEKHCPMVIEVMNTEGTVTAFCRRALISEKSFYEWVSKHPIFKECYLIGKIFSKANWEEEGRKGVKKKNFNMEYWRITGAMRYGVGRDRVRMLVDAKSNPYVQYQQLIELAAQEEFNASEIKQLMESINVGIRAFESFELQKEVDSVKEDLEKMRVNNANNRSSVATT